MSALTAAALLSLVSAISYALAAIGQERIAATTSPSRWGLLRSGTWWTAAGLQGAGALLHVVALGLGPLTVVQPLGVLTLVLAAPMAAAVGRRRVAAATWRGILLVSAGLAGVLLLTGDAGADSLRGSGQLSLATSVLAALALLVGAAAVLGRRGRARPGSRALAVRSVCLALAAGVAYGAASVFVKTLADRWMSAPLLISVPLAVLTVALAAAGLATSQASYRGGGLATPLATATVANPVVAAAAGIVLLDEGFRYGATGAVLALVAGAVATWGLVALTVDSARRTHGAPPGHTSPDEPGRTLPPPRDGGPQVPHGGGTGHTADAEFAHRKRPADDRRAEVPRAGGRGKPVGRRPVAAR
ncbi:DMT family transporter [Streptomyces tubbatahanensis]|uniref:DMT family transporter n=1 Tax=Streptomyces tubbatahanensis TaxID=2923272 RepID=A0ABY3XMS3_9ACTN|nr:DMT family transporter [Streptomyces tubbatahanensis]UNS95712.1 DMT family transporter [Streptomyces tubbatahanensis]